MKKADATIAAQQIKINKLRLQLSQAKNSIRILKGRDEAKRAAASGVALDRGDRRKQIEKEVALLKEEYLSLVPKHLLADARRAREHERGRELIRRAPGRTPGSVPHLRHQGSSPHAAREARSLSPSRHRIAFKETNQRRSSPSRTKSKRKSKSKSKSKSKKSKNGGGNGSSYFAMYRKARGLSSSSSDEYDEYGYDDYYSSYGSSSASGAGGNGVRRRESEWKREAEQRREADRWRAEKRREKEKRKEKRRRRRNRRARKGRKSAYVPRYMRGARNDERLEAIRAEQAAKEIEPCSFAPQLNAKSRAIAARKRAANPDARNQLGISAPNGGAPNGGVNPGGPRRTPVQSALLGFDLLHPDDGGGAATTTTTTTTTTTAKGKQRRPQSENGALPALRPTQRRPRSGIE